MTRASPYRAWDSACAVATNALEGSKAAERGHARASQAQMRRHPSQRRPEL